MSEMTSLVRSWWEAVPIFALVDAFLERLRSYTSYTWKLFLPRDPSTSPEAFLVYGHHPEWFSVIIIITIKIAITMIIITIITTTGTIVIVILMPKLLHPPDCPESRSGGQSQRVSRPLHLLKCWPIAMTKNAEEKSTIRDGGSTALYTDYTVDTVNTAFAVYNV